MFRRIKKIDWGTFIHITDMYNLNLNSPDLEQSRK